MALERLSQLVEHVTATPSPAHPFDPLSATEIEKAVALISEKHGQLAFNAVTVYEPPKADMQAWLANPKQAKRPHRVADVVAIRKGGTVFDGLVDLEENKILKWEALEGVQPLVWSRFCCKCHVHVEANLLQITMEDLQIVEHVVRKDAKVIEQCEISGIPRSEMHKVYCDRKSSSGYKSSH